MSRALNINASEEHVRATCARRKLPISAIEALFSGGTRVVLNNMADTDILGSIYGSKVMLGAVQRTPIRLGRL